MINYALGIKTRKQKLIVENNFPFSFTKEVFQNLKTLHINKHCPHHPELK